MTGLRRCCRQWPARGVHAKLQGLTFKTENSRLVKRRGRGEGGEVWRAPFIQSFPPPPPPRYGQFFAPQFPLSVSLSQVPIVNDEFHGKTGTWKGTERQLTATAQFQHSYMYVSDLYIPTIGPHIWLQQIDTPILEILYVNFSHIYECRYWETEYYNSILEITRLHSLISGNTHKSDIYIGLSPALHLQCMVEDIFSWRALWFIEPTPKCLSLEKKGHTSNLSCTQK